MLATILYPATAFATAAQVYWLLAWGIWGAPTSPLQYVSICGSLALLIAGLVSKWKRRAAEFTAVGASLVIWCFYAPALIHTLAAWPTKVTVQAGLIAFTPVFLLVMSTVHAINVIAGTYRAA
jgi:hypothetical protein